jgi:dienelactone hydrolase
LNRLQRYVGLFVLVATLSAACVPALNAVKPTLTAADSGTIWFATAGSLGRSQVGARLVPSDPVVLSAELRFPSGAGPFPAVILAHGCGGPGNADAGWAQALPGWGYAAFVVDSFRGRGLSEVCTNARALLGTQRIPDVYGALRILATHPKVDARRVALMGFSHGGIVTLGASTTWAKQAFAPAGHPAFRAFLAFYPYCNTAYPERQQISAPLRIHAGERDDWTPAAPCTRLAEILSASGQDATITVYPGALHSFDNVGRPPTYLRNVDSGADCALRMPSILGPLPGAAETAQCLRKGATIGWSREATEQARRNVRGQLAELLK